MKVRITLSLVLLLCLSEILFGRENHEKSFPFQMTRA